MKLENQVCSLELAKRLKELAVKQESLFYWWRLNGFESWIIINPILDRRTVESYNEAYPTAEIYSAFTVAELGEMLPDEYFTLCKTLGGHTRIDFGDDQMMSAHTEADCRAKMLIYLIENNLINPNKEKE